MWGHYCDKHGGLVIGFDSSNSIFQKLREVDYVRERVIFDATWTESDPKIGVFETEMTFSKNKDWIYEEELRQLFTLDSLVSKPLDDGTPGYFLPIPSEAVMSVALGAKCSGELERKVRSTLSQSCYSHVKLDRVILHDSKFALTFQ
jgi:hypothetical protein